ncbi:MAG: hypothetical protein QM831_10185 [Kofleriaceae bacterium]
MKLIPVLVLLIGCSDLVQLEPDPLGNLTQLVVTPKSTELVISDLSQPPAEQKFRAIGVFSDGARRDVTDQIVWNVDNPLPGGFPQPGVFATSNQAAGDVTVIALADDVWTTADVTVRIDATLVDPAFPPSDPNLFDDGAKPIKMDPDRSPALVYPSDGTLFPQGLPSTVFQWTRGTLNDAFRLTFTTDLLKLTVITGSDRWESGSLQTLLSQSNLGERMMVSIDAAAVADPGTIYQGTPIGMTFSADAPDSTMYFWSAGEQGIMRGSMSASFAGKLYPSDTTCVGCHSVSRDGARLAMGYGAESVSLLQSIDSQTLGTQISKSQLYDGGWTTYSPDGSLVLIADQGSLYLRDANTGAPINGPTGKVALPANHYASHPDWSPDGKYVTVAYTSLAPTNLDIKSASIARLAYDEATRTFSGPQILVAATAVDNYYFPRYSPDGSLIAFTHATETSKGAASAELELVPYDGGYTTVLSVASGVATATQMPSWAPFKGDHAWLAFSSARPYGVVIPSGGRSQIWVTAVDLSQFQPGVDTSASSFWLPCQDPTVTNNNPIWAPSEITTQ